MNVLMIILATTERLLSAGKIVASEFKEAISSKESLKNKFVYAVIRDQLEYCQNGGENSPCKSYCAVPEGAHYHGTNTFSPEQTTRVGTFLKENNIRIAAHVGAEGYHRMPTLFTWQKGLDQLSSQASNFITGYYADVLNTPIDPSRPMDGTDLSIIKDAILKDQGNIVHRPTNGIDLLTRGEKGKKLIPLIARFVDHLTFSYHFAWNPNDVNFEKQQKRLEKFLELTSFSSHYTATKFFRVLTQDRDPSHTLALADKVLQQGSVFFDFGVHDGKGNFSTDNQDVVPTQYQIETVSLGLMARLLFMDQMIETNLDYLLMMPAFGDTYLNCGGSEKAVLVIRADKKGTPFLDVCSEIEANIPLPVELNDKTVTDVFNHAASSCGNCRQQCEYPFKWNRDVSLGSMRPLTAITTLKQIGKAARVQGFGNPVAVRYTPYRREQLTDRTFIKKLLQVRANMIADRFSMPYWQHMAHISGLSQEDIDQVIERYSKEAHDEDFITQYQEVERNVAQITPGSYPDEKFWYNKVAHNVAKSWGGGFVLEGPLIVTPRKEIIAYAPVKAIKRLREKVIFSNE